MVGAGAVVTLDVPAFAIVVGNPARIVGYVNSDNTSARPAWPGALPEEENSAARAIDVRGVTIHRLKLVRDLRGDLVVGDFASSLPFTPQRFFTIFGVPSARIRGSHAHRVCKQFLIAVHGALSLVVDDGSKRSELRLDRPDIGVYVPAMVWATQYRFTDDAVLLVFASLPYEPSDYLRNYEEFMKALAQFRA
jgi:hypothetical protein